MTTHAPSLESFPRAAQARRLLAERLGHAPYSGAACSLVDVARACALPTYRDWSAVHFAGELFRRAVDAPADEVVGDFPLVLGAALDDVLVRAFERAERTYDRWVSFNTFGAMRPFRRPRVTLPARLAPVDENAPYPTLSRHELGEAATPVKIGGTLSFTREALLADRLEALTEPLEAFAQAARSTINAAVYDTLRLNPNLADGFPLFDPILRQNDSSVGGFLDETTRPAYDRAREDMANQKEPNGERLNLRPRFLLGPPEAETGFDVLLGARYRPGTARPFELGGRVEPVIDPDIGGLGSYLAAQPGKTVEVSHLNGIDRPTITRGAGWSYDAWHYKASLVYAVTPLDYRGLHVVRNAS